MKALYIIACVLLIVAIAVEVNAKRHYFAAAQVHAKSAGLSTERQAKQDADASIRVGGRFSTAGLIMAGLGVVSWVASNAKGRKGTPVLPVVLLAAYALIFFIMV